MIRLRDAIAFYDSLPDKTRKRFRAATDVSDLHFGFGMFLRNAILWKNDIKLLAVELKVVREEVGKGRSTLTYTQVSDAADRLATGRFPDHADRVSNALMHVLRLREDGKLELLELN